MSSPTYRSYRTTTSSSSSASSPASASSSRSGLSATNSGRHASHSDHSPLTPRHPIWGNEDIDADSTTSSEEEESLSSSSSSDVGELQNADNSEDIGLFDAQARLSDESDSEVTSEDSVCELEGPDRTPRRIIRRKLHIQHAIECLVEILIKYDAKNGEEVANSRTILDAAPIPQNCGHIVASSSAQERTGSRTHQRALRKTRAPDRQSDQHWSRSVKLLALIREDGDATKDPVSIRSCLGVSQWLLGRIIPLIHDKDYLSTLTGLERRAVRSMGSSDSLLPTGLTILPTYLDLSNLSFLPLAHLRSIFDQDAIPTCLEILGSSPLEVTHLKLSDNGLIDLDEIAIWHIAPFPNIQVLGLCHNPKLSCVPLSFCRLLELRKVKTRGTRIRIRESAQQQAYDWRVTRTPCEVKVHSATLANLVHLCISAIIKEKYLLYPSERAQWTREVISSLPSHLAEMIERSFICDRCLRVCIPPMGPTEKHPEGSHSDQTLVRVNEAWELDPGRRSQIIRVEGICCMRCWREVHRRRRPLACTYERR